MKVNVNTLRLSTACVAVSAILAGCGGGGSNGLPKINSTNPVSGSLQFAVGTANLYGTGIGLNVVSTFRQANGLSSVLVDTPTITGPFKLPVGEPGIVGSGVDPYSTLPVGPSVEEIASGQITGTSQSLHPGTPACDSTTPCNVASASGGTVTVAPNTSTFGQSGGVFTNGISPGNYTNQGVAASYVPYTQPLYDTSSGNAFVPFGGPPAFDPNGTGLGLRDGLQSIGSGALGIPLGISTFYGTNPAAGTYGLSVSIPTGTTGYGTITASAKLTNLVTLGGITAPDLALDGKGGGTFTVTALPTGATEELVQIVDQGVVSEDTATTCQGALGATLDTAGGGAGPVYYTILVTKPGTYTLPDTIGPNTNVSGGVSGITPSPSICTAAQNTAAAGGTATPADTYTVQAIGADYPLYESLYPNSKSETPTIVGASGQADITISALAGPGAATASAHMRAALHRRGVTGNLKGVL
jgi:hypothetical protein